MGKVTLNNKICKVVHSDLILGRSCEGLQVVVVV